MKLRIMAAWLGFLAVPCYLIDQWTKWLIHTGLDVGIGFVVIPGFFDIIHARNTGAAFGILRGLPEAYRIPFFGLITVIACGAILIIFWKTAGDSRLLKAALCLIVAGALGNLTDRLIFGEVVDFLSFHVGRFRWPTFNMADTWITMGMAGLIVQTFLMPREE